ncbi:MAG TPA: AtpZ/AtpI family protein [Ignavibacteriaceae bacterium]|jgi:F0F1-type ATP synthase assembly protein I|nr:AtpZ/AtpI family protein [Ignavibacteriaceae bacterium]
MPKEESDLVKTYRDVAPYLGLGFQLAATIVIMVFIGDWLDKKYETTPVYTIIFAVFGVFAGLYNLIKTVLKTGKKSDNDEKK